MEVAKSDTRRVALWVNQGGELFARLTKTNNRSPEPGS